MPKNKKGKAKAHFDSQPVKEAPTPPAPPPPPVGKSPAYSNAPSDGLGSLSGYDQTPEEIPNGHQTAGGWGAVDGEENDNGEDGWGNQGGTAWDNENGEDEDNGGGGGWGNTGGGGWGDDSGKGGGWDVESNRDQSEDDGWEQADQLGERGSVQSWAQSAQHTKTRQPQSEYQTTNQAATPHWNTVNMAPSGGRAAQPAGWQSWGQQAAAAAPTGRAQNPPQMAPARHAPAQPPAAWGSWAAEARRASQAGILPSNSGNHGMYARRDNPPPVATLGVGGWGTRNSHVPSVPLHAAPNGGQRQDLSQQQRAQILGALLGRAQQQGIPTRQPLQHQPVHRAPERGRHRAQEQSGRHHLGRHNFSRAQDWDHITEEDEEEEEEEEDSDDWQEIRGEDITRRPSPSGRLTSVLSSVIGPRKIGISYPMPSRTMAIAAQGGHPVANGNFTQDRRNSQQPVRFGETKWAAIIPAERALFGRDRKAMDRIHWMFSPLKDQRVRSLLTWIDGMSQGLATFGLQKFFETRERGALFTNAGFRAGDAPPSFDWLTFDQLQVTRDRTIQESVAYYDPAVNVIVFVFLLSPSGNSMAMWRRKLTVPNNLRLKYTQEIELTISALRKDYEIHVDELPRAMIEEPFLPPSDPPPKKKKGFWARLKFW